MSPFDFKNDLLDINHYELGLYSIANSSFKKNIKGEISFLIIFFSCLGCPSVILKAVVNLLRDGIM